jgi:ribonuclease HI
MKIELYTDGSATVNTKPGGWAYVIVIDGQFHSEGLGHVEFATNNDMELMAALKGLDAVLNLITTNPSSFPVDFEVTLKSDSLLILGWTNGSYRFKQIDKIALYEELRRLAKKLRVKTEWVKGHAGHQWNERCDELANKARLKIEYEKGKEEAKATGKSLIGKKKEGVFCLWYKGTLRIIDLDNFIIENYSRSMHGNRGSLFEIREDRNRTV